MVVGLGVIRGKHVEIKSGGKHTWTSVKGKIHRKEENTSSFLPVLNI